MKGECQQQRRHGTHETDNWTVALNQPTYIQIENSFSNPNVLDVFWGVVESDLPNITDYAVFFRGEFLNYVPEPYTRLYNLNPNTNYSVSILPVNRNNNTKGVKITGSKKTSNSTGNTSHESDSWTSNLPAPAQVTVVPSNSVPTRLEVNTQAAVNTVTGTTYAIFIDDVFYTYSPNGYLLKDFLVQGQLYKFTVRAVIRGSQRRSPDKVAYGRPGTHESDGWVINLDKPDYVELRPTTDPTILDVFFGQALDMTGVTDFAVFHNNVFSSYKNTGYHRLYNVNTTVKNTAQVRAVNQVQGRRSVDVEAFFNP